MRRLWVFLCACQLIAPAHASDHLMPTTDSLDQVLPPIGYDQVVITAFKRAYRPDVQARAFILPSWAPQVFVGIVEQQGQYGIIGISPTVNLAGSRAEMLDNGSIRVFEPYDAAAKPGSARPDSIDVKLDRCEVPIDEALGEVLVDLWQSMLLQVRYFPQLCNYKVRTNCERIVSDGDAYHFSTFEMAGWDWSPEPDSLPGRLVHITEVMHDACKTHRRKDIEMLRSLAASLSNDVKAPTP